MIRPVLAGLGLLAVLAAGVALGATSPGEHVACATASATAPGYTVADHVIADNGTPLGTITGSSSPGSSDTQTACVTATDQTVSVTGPTTTVTSTVHDTVTVTTTAATTTAPPPPPPPPPTGKQSINGPLLFRYGSSWTASPSSGYERYGAVVVACGDYARAAALNTKALAYFMSGEVFQSTCRSGVGSMEAAQNGWLLSPTGTDGETVWFADLANVAFQNRWVQNVAATLSANHLDGVFLDNVLCDYVDEFASGGPPTATQRAAMTAFIKAVSGQLQALGYYVIANVYCYGSNGGDYQANDAWWQQAVPPLNGAISETFEQSQVNYNDVIYDRPADGWPGVWKGRADVVDIAQAAGVDAWELTTGRNATVSKYACGTLLLHWDGAGGGCAVDTGGTDPFDANGWAFPIGTPTAAVASSGAAFYRTFTAGKVIVNPSLSSVVVQGVAVAARSAYIGP